MCYPWTRQMYVCSITAGSLYFAVLCPAVAQARCGGEADPIVSCPVVRCRSTDITCSVGLSSPHEDAAYISVCNLHRLRSFFAIAHRCPILQSNHAAASEGKFGGFARNTSHVPGFWEVGRGIIYAYTQSMVGSLHSNFFFFLPDSR